MSPEQWSQQFRRRRFGLRACLILGIVSVLIPGSSAGDALSATGRDLFRFSGVALLVVLFPLYHLYGNRCPRCCRSFSEAAEYGGPDTRGLPLLNAIRSCPFCGVSLGGREQDGVRGQAADAEPGAAVDPPKAAGH